MFTTHRSATTKWWGGAAGLAKCTQHRVASVQDQNRTMVTTREKWYKSKYPHDGAAAVLVSNETHWYMLPIHLIIPLALHDKCVLARSLSLARPSWIHIFPRPEADGKITKSWVMLSTRLSWKPPQLLPPYKKFVLEFYLLDVIYFLGVVFIQLLLQLLFISYIIFRYPACLFDRVSLP